MTQFFENLLTASFHGSIVIAVILLLRPLLRRAPRKFVCLLWLLAGLRLLVPIQISSPVSLQPEPVTSVADFAPIRDVPYVPGPDFVIPDAPVREDPVIYQQEVPAQLPEAPVSQPEPQPTDWMAVAAYTWLAGLGVIALASLVSYVALRRRVREAIRVKEGIWVCDRINTAFIFGYIRPRIYIPMGISRSNCKHILAHERTHLEKGDHWFKLIGFIALTVHWFNPLVWLAYVLLCKDIEIACDERVVQFMDLEERKSYSAALLACSARRSHFTVCPVAFGEVSVKERIHRVLKYKKPSFWISLLAVAALAFVAVCFLTSPEKDAEVVPETTEVTETTGETIPQVVAAPEHDLSDLPEDIPQEEYVDPNGHNLRLYVYGEKPAGAVIGLSMGYGTNTSYDERSKLGRAMTFTEAYWIEQEVKGNWKKLEPKADPGFNDLTYNLSDHFFESRIDWTALYGELYDGHFRLGKNLVIDGEDHTYYGEFWIEDNDPVKEPEVKKVVDRIHAAIDEVVSRECVHVVNLFDSVQSDGAFSGSTDLLWSGSDYLQMEYNPMYGGSGMSQTACYGGVSFRGYDGQWYNAGDTEFYFAGDGWNYAQKLDGYHVTLDTVKDEKVALILDRVDNGLYRREYRDFYFDAEGKLTQIEKTIYYRSDGQLYTQHSTNEIYVEEKGTLTSKLEAVKANAGNHTYEEYEQLMREKEFDKDFMLGAGDFLWRQKDWAYRIGGEEGSATATGMMVNHVYANGGSQGSLYTQGGFWIEEFEDGKWSRVPVPAGNPLPAEDAKLIFDNTNGLTNPTRMRCDWSETYGTLEPGFYRVAQNYKLTAGGEENIKTCYAKFRVYDPNGETYLAQVRQGMKDLLDRDSYCIEISEDLMQIRDDGKRDIRYETIWKRANGDYFKSYDLEDDGKGASYSILLNGKGYGTTWDITEGWEYIAHFNRETFEYWQTSDFYMMDSCISTVEKDGNVITVNHDAGEYKQKFVFTFDDAGRIVAGQAINLENEPVLTFDFTVEDVTEAELDSIFSKYDITKPGSFSFAEDQKLFPNYDSWKTSGFKNTTAVTISTAQEAEERAKKDCTLLPWEDETGVHQGGWNLVKAFFDESAQMWKVEFTFSQGGVYQAVYMTADGVTTNVIS